MAAKKKASKKKASKKKASKSKIAPPASPPKGGGAGRANAPGTVRFKYGFPRGIREEISREFPGNWHLELRILDDDDGEDDDGSIDTGDNGNLNKKGGPAANGAKTPARRKRPAKAGRSK